jgi:hypothetical protein
MRAILLEHYRTGVRLGRQLWRFCEVVDIAILFPYYVIKESEKGKAMQNKIYEIAGYVAIALTVIGQIVINMSAIAGQSLWMIANILYLIKAVKQNMGKAEIIRNVIMSAITTGLIILCALGVF